MRKILSQSSGYSVDNCALASKRFEGLGIKLAPSEHMVDRVRSRNLKGGGFRDALDRSDNYSRGASAAHNALDFGVGKVKGGQSDGSMDRAIGDKEHVGVELLQLRKGGSSNRASLLLVVQAAQKNDARLTMPFQRSRDK